MSEYINPKMVEWLSKEMDFVKEYGKLNLTELRDLLLASKARIMELEREIKYLRQYGNKDCTAMADDAMRAE